MQETTLSQIYEMPVEQLGAITLLGMNKAQVCADSFSVVMEVKDIHLNTFGTVHGGILYTLCDQAAGAFIALKKLKAVGMDGTIHYYRPAKKGDILTATAYERKSGRKTGVYFTELKDQNDKLIADAMFTAMYL